MIYPPLFAICAADSTVQSLLGSSPCRVHMFGQVVGTTTKPYCVWQVIGGNPENFLAGVPDADSWSVQVDVYATTASDAREAATALRDAIEPHAYVTSWRGEERDSTTKAYRCSFDVDFITEREITST